MLGLMVLSFMRIIAMAMLMLWTSDDDDDGDDDGSGGDDDSDGKDDGRGDDKDDSVFELCRFFCSFITTILYKLILETHIV